MGSSAADGTGTWQDGSERQSIPSQMAERGGERCSLEKRKAARQTGVNEQLSSLKTLNVLLEVSVMDL